MVRALVVSRRCSSTSRLTGRPLSLRGDSLTADDPPPTLPTIFSGGCSCARRPMEATFATRSVGTSRERDTRRWSRPLRSMRLEGLGLLTADEERFVTMGGINQPPCRPILVFHARPGPFHQTRRMERGHPLNRNDVSYVLSRIPVDNPGSEQMFDPPRRTSIGTDEVYIPQIKDERLTPMERCAN